MVQIVLVVILLAFLFYVIFDVMNFPLLDFLSPAVENISKFMRDCFEESFNKGAASSDGSLFVLGMFILLLVATLTHLKKYSVTAGKAISRMINKIKIKNEDEFNAQLRAEADQALLAYRNVVLLTKFVVRKKHIDDLRSEEEINKEQNEKLDKIVCEYYSRIKEAPSCKFAKNGDQLVVTLKGFAQVDKLLYYANKAIDELKEELKQENWILTTYSAIDAFSDQALLKDVYYDLQILLKLHIKNECICYGNFCNRYYMESRNLFEAYLKGVYDMTEPENVWTLVKKY